jgi:hypothetical protein
VSVAAARCALSMSASVDQLQPRVAANYKDGGMKSC